MVGKQKIPRWYPVRPIKPKDHMVSSDYANYSPFVPSYVKDNVNMFLLMAHDYAKLWKMENKAIEKTRFEFAGEEHERLCRRYVLRALQKKRKVAEAKPRFIMKRFQNIPSKVRQYMYPGKTAQVKQECSGRLKQSLSKIASAKDSRELLLEKQKSSEMHSNNGRSCDAAEVTISPEMINCVSEMDVVSSASATTNLLALKGSSQKSKGSKMNEMSRAHNHFHVAFDGSKVHVREMPPGHRHPLKKNAIQ